MPRHVLAAVCLLSVPLVHAQEIVSERAEEGPALTVYQQDLALVRERRTVELPKGRVELVVNGISRQIVPESSSVVAQGLEVSSINYLPVTLTPEALLERYIGKAVTVVHRAPLNGAPAREQGTLLSAGNGRPLVRIGDRVEIGGPDAPWQLAFDSVPADLRGKDSLVVELDSASRGRRTLDLTYLTRGLSWQADYLLELDERGREARLSAWATLDNRTGMPVQNAKVRLVAGAPNQVRQPQPMYAARAMKAEAADMAQEALHDYRVYTLSEPVDLLGQQRKQVRLLAPRQVPLVREYETEGHALHLTADPQDTPVQVLLKLRNEAPRLGQPLPAGTVRVYGDGPGKQLQFLGEDHMPQSVPGQELELKLGSATELSSKRTPASSNRIDQNTTEVEWVIELRNAKSEPVTVTVVEHLPGDWRILEESDKHRKAAAQEAHWRLEVPAQGKRELRYRAQLRL